MWEGEGAYNSLFFNLKNMSSKRTAAQRLLIITKSRYNVIIPKINPRLRYYATINKKIEASMGGIFEPFLNDKM
jgi:hypothetical protein